MAVAKRPGPEIDIAARPAPGIDQRGEERIRGDIDAGLFQIEAAGADMQPVGKAERDRLQAGHGRLLRQAG